MVQTMKPGAFLTCPQYKISSTATLQYRFGRQEPRDIRNFVAEYPISCVGVCEELTGMLSNLLEGMPKAQLQELEKLTKLAEQINQLTKKAKKD